MSVDPYTHSGEVRTDIYCHECKKDFVALLDYDIEGNHEIICPHCGHTHFRVIKGGKVTEDRHNSSIGGPNTKPRRVWKHSVLKAQTNSASWFIRERWLDKL